jgi:hypothetical protein
MCRYKVVNGFLMLCLLFHNYPKIALSKYFSICTHLKQTAHWLILLLLVKWQTLKASEK